MQQNQDLTDFQKQVLFQKATEAPFSGEHLQNKQPGVYSCANCGQVLFSSTTKFDSGSGWPSFYDVAEQGAVRIVSDSSHGMERTEVVCAQCGGHLGHIFEDAYTMPTGKRYCINSVCLAFNEDDKKETV